MTSPLLALFARSLREDTRLKLTYFARSGLVTVILIFMHMVDTSGGMGTGQGLGFFGTVIYVDLVFILLAGCGYFASAITEEKEEMTKEDPSDMPSLFSTGREREREKQGRMLRGEERGSMAEG